MNDIDSQWDVYLADVSNIGKVNDGYNFMLFAIHIYSRYLWVVPVKTKFSHNVLEALHIVCAFGRKQWTIPSDKGKEFMNRKVELFLNQHSVKHFTIEDSPKTNYDERSIRSIKYRYFSRKKSYRYVQVLQNLVRSTKTDNTDRLETHPEQRSIKNTRNNSINTCGGNFKYEIGARIRISHLRHLFQRS